MSTNAATADPGPQRDVRPSVGRATGNASIWLFVVAALVIGLLLFSALDTRRRELSAPAVRVRAADLAQLPVSPPSLYIPPEPVITRAQPRSLAPDADQFQMVPQPPAPDPSPFEEPYIPPAPSPPVELAPPPAPPSGGSVLILDTTATQAAQAGASPADAGEGTPAVAIAQQARVRATQSRQRETTIAQGTLIPAVLETALDSTRPGQARALVSQDVRGYGGKYVLIPRGSRLFGEYRADLAPGQNRALVQWTRLVRPDGVTIAIDSPAADTLGRAGIKGEVNSHFFQRFGAAILQSVLDLGVSVATRSVGDSPVIVALPNGALAGQAIAQPQQIQPTLTVRQGARISVFVARDLDFTAVERRR